MEHDPYTYASTTEKCPECGGTCDLATNKVTGQVYVLCTDCEWAREVRDAQKYKS